MKSTQPLFPRLVSVVAILMLGILLNLPWQPATAAPVTAKQAAAVVTGWLALDRTPLGESLGPSVQRVDSFGDNAGSALYYVVYLDPAGFVIVAGDDLVEPIIGFARAGTFDPSTSNPLGALVNNDLSARVAYARQANAAALGQSALQAQSKWQQLTLQAANPASKGPTSQMLASVSNVRIAPLTQSTWDQETAAGAGTAACYNYYTPPYGPGNINNYPAGCVATAMAQLMRYYQFPTVGVGAGGFWITNSGAAQIYYLHGGNTVGGPYVWANMPLVPPASPTAAQCQAIGALVADAGATVNMSYTTTGSSASVLDAKDALVGTFHYGNAIEGWNNRNDIGSGLAGMINPNLDARYPVLLGIQGVSGGQTNGHAVVADGYGYSSSTLYHHLNLGWSGINTAWYALPLVDTSIFPFTAVHSCLYNLYTNGSGEIVSGRVVDQIGRPVASAAVTATRTGGGTYISTTDTNGIYALARIPSASSYSITVSKANYSTTNGTFWTGTSTDRAATSGNYWGANFVINMLPTAVDHLAWGTIGATQGLNTPFGVTVSALNADNLVVAGFTGPVALSGYRTGMASTNTIVGNLGDFQTDTDPSWNWTYGYSFTPNTNIQVVSVRTYSGTRVSIWTDTGTFIGSQAVTSPPGVWTETTLSTPILLSAGATYRVGIYCPIGTTSYFTYWAGEWPTNFANGTVGQNLYYLSADGFPNNIGGTGVGPFLDLRYTVPYSNSVPISPTSSGAFVNGVWNGVITVAQTGNNVVLKADDGAGHTALSSAFNVIPVVRLLSPQRLADGKFQCTVSSAAGLKLEMQGSTNPANPSAWGVVTNLTNTTGTILFTDPGTSPQRRFYRARQLP